MRYRKGLINVLRHLMRRFEKTWVTVKVVSTQYLKLRQRAQYRDAGASKNKDLKNSESEMKTNYKFKSGVILNMSGLSRKCGICRTIHLIKSQVD